MFLVVRTSRAVDKIGADTADAILAAGSASGQIATLIVPADVAWGDEGVVAKMPTQPRRAVPNAAAVEHAAAMLRSGRRTGILLSGAALYGKGLATAGRIATATGVKLFVPSCESSEGSTGLRWNASTTS